MESLFYASIFFITLLSVLTWWIFREPKTKRCMVCKKKVTEENRVEITGMNDAPVDYLCRYHYNKMFMKGQV